MNDLLNVKASEAIRSWYYKSGFIANIDRISGLKEYELKGIFYPICSIATAILEKHVSKNLVYKIGDLDSALGAADKDESGNRVIFINSRIISNPTLKPIPSEEEFYEFIAAANGVAIHESFHIAKTPEDFEVYIDFSSPARAFIFQILEDYFIDERQRIELPSLTWMQEWRYRKFFSDIEVEWNGEKPITSEETQQALKQLVAWKNPANRTPATEFAKMLLEVATSVEAAIDFQERVKIINNVYSLLTDYDENDVDSEGGESSSMHESVPGAGEDGESSSMHESVPGAGEDGESSLMYESVPGAGEDGDNPIGIEKTIKSLDDHSHTTTIKPVVVDEFTELDGINVYTVRPEDIIVEDEYTHEYVNLNELDERWDEVKKIAKEVANGKPTYRLASKTGTNFGDLSRIGFSDKIFESYPVTESKTRGNRRSLVAKQVILLGDFSGSMRHASINEACKALLSACVSLRMAGHNVSVYGHTGDVFDLLPRSVVLYELATWDDPISLLKSRLDLILGNTYYALGNNYDGYAIQQTAQKFKKGNGSKHIIIISDGSPSGLSYTGDKAIHDSRDRVNKLRTKGINVHSLSIEHVAVHSNNRIYGERNNTYNRDPNAISELVRMILRG